MYFKMKLDFNNISLIAVDNYFTIRYNLQAYESIEFIQEVMTTHCYFWYMTKAVINIYTDMRLKK
jgi:hypothetical protein